MENTAGSARFVATAFLILLGAGCGEPRFVYVPSPPIVADGPKFPYHAAVVVFKDACAAPALGRDGTGEKRVFHLTVDPSPTWPRLTPERLTQAFVDELAASGLVQSARVAASRREAREEQVVVEGTLREVSLSLSDGAHGTYAFALDLEARFLPPWEKSLFSPAGETGVIGPRGGMGLWTKSFHRRFIRTSRRPMADLNDLLRIVYAEAIRDLAEEIDHQPAPEHSELGAPPLRR